MVGYLPLMWYECFRGRGTGGRGLWVFHGGGGLRVASREEVDYGLFRKMGWWWIGVGGNPTWREYGFLKLYSGRSKPTTPG